MVEVSKQGKVTCFLGIYQSKSTRRNYRIALTDFFSNIYKDNPPPRGFNSRVRRVEWLDDQAACYFSEDRDYERDIQDFLVSLNGRAPKTVRMKIAAVRTFLVENDVELSQKFWRRLRRKVRGSRALTLDKVPSNSELRKLIFHMPIHGKALFLLLSSSGMRIGEASQLRVEDLTLEETPMRIHIRGEYTKSGNSRYAFASKETKEAIEEWLKVRGSYLESAVRKSHLFEKEARDTRLFPFEKTTAYAVWNNALEKARMDRRDSSTNFRKIHPHVLRKFFRTRMATLIPVDLVEALMGHEGYLTEVYRRYSQKDLANFYLEGESALLVFTETEQVTLLRKEVEESKEQLQTLVNGVTAENLELKSRMSRMELEKTELAKRVQRVRARVRRQDETVQNLQGEIKKIRRYWGLYMRLKDEEFQEWDDILTQQAIEEEHARVLRELENREVEKAEQKAKSLAEEIRQKHAQK